MFGGDKDGFIADSIHVNGGTSLKVIKVDVAALGDHINDAIFVTDLHSDWEIILMLWREIDLNGLFLEGRIAFLMIDFNDLKLSKGLIVSIKVHFPHPYT